VVFAAWRPFRLLAGASFFGLMMIFEVYAKSNSAFRVLPSEFWAALPYLATVVVLVLISLRRTGNNSAPACLGKPFIATA
jgi:simple sugar transport system permease protein